MRHSLLATVVVSTLAVVSAPAAAQSPQAQEIAELKAQIAALAARVQELETRTDDASAAPAAAVAQTTSPQPVVTTKGGLKVTSADKAFEVSLGGRIHFDAYAFDRDQAEPTGTTEFRRARLTLQGDTVLGEERLLNEIGERVRDVRVGPDGNVYVVTDEEDGKLLRIEPPKAP